MTTFSAQVSQWVHETEGAMEAVFKGSVQDVLEYAQRNIPIDTGYLRASLMIGINDEPEDIEEWKPKSKDEKYSGRSQEAFSVEILGAGLGDVIKARWTAEYASSVEYGHRTYGVFEGLGRQQTGFVPGRGYVRTAIQQWPNIVAANEDYLGRTLGR